MLRRRGSVTLIGAGVVIALLAALAGLTDVVGDRRIRDLTELWWHAGGNVLVVLIQLYNWSGRFEHGSAAILPVGLILSLVVVGILLFTGWRGWKMTDADVVRNTDVPNALFTCADQPCPSECG